MSSEDGLANINVTLPLRQETLDTCVGALIALSEELFYAAEFAIAQRCLHLPFLEDLTQFGDRRRIALASQHAKIEIFRSSLSMDSLRYAEVLRDLLELAAAAHALEDKPTYATYLSTLALAYLYNGDPDSAMQFYDQASRLFKDIGDGSGEAGARAFLIMIKHNVLDREGDRGRVLDLVPEYEKEIAFAAEVGNSLAGSYNTRHLGRIYLVHLEDLDRAYELYAASLSLREEVGFLPYIPPSYSSLGDIFDQKGDTGQAIEMYSRSVQVAEQAGFVRYQVYPRMQIGDIHKREGDLEKAKEFYEQALKAAEINQYLDGIQAAVAKLGD